MKTCEECKYFESIEPKGLGNCLRHPPMLRAYSSGYTCWEVPTIASTRKICGEFKVKDETNLPE